MRGIGRDLQLHAISKDRTVKTHDKNAQARQLLDLQLRQLEKNQADARRALGKEIGILSRQCQKGSQRDVAVHREHGKMCLQRTIQRQISEEPYVSCDRCTQRRLAKLSKIIDEVKNNQDNEEHQQAE